MARDPLSQGEKGDRMVSKMNRRIFRSVGLAVIALLLAASIGAVVAQAEGAGQSRSVTEKELLEIVAPVIDSYSEYYDVVSTSISGIRVVEHDGGYYADFVLGMGTVLKSQNATGLPHVRGMAESLGIDSTKMTTERFISSLAEVDCSRLFSSSLSEHLAGSLVNNEAVRDEVVGRVASFVEGIESEHIGKVSDTFMRLRAEFSAAGVPTGLKCEVYDRYESIAHVLPDSYERMVENGKEHVSSLISLAVRDVGEDVTTNATTAEPYYRLVARDYANQYTSNATQWCPHYPEHETKQDQSYWNGNFTGYCHNDCANYVSQAMWAGDVPTSGTWYEGSGAWIDCGHMKDYFYPNPSSGLWMASTYAACNEGGIMLMFDSGGTARHVNMCVYNDTVIRKLSAHTTDRKQFAYDSSWLYQAGGHNEYYVFRNAYPSH